MVRDSGEVSVLGPLLFSYQSAPSVYLVRVSTSVAPALGLGSICHVAVESQRACVGQLVRTHCSGYSSNLE